MEPKSYSFKYIKYDSDKEVPKEELELLKCALKSRNSAYAPYSDFLVGAAVQLENGEIISANNQENAAYPSGLCAERVAVFFASSKFPGVKIKKIAVCGAKRDSENNLKDNVAVPPCGACRQSILEYEQKQNQNIEIIFFEPSLKNIIKVNSITDLLPFTFSSDFL